MKIGDGKSLRLPLRLRRAAQALAYILLSVPLGLLSAVAVTTAAVGGILSVVWIGRPLLLAAVTTCRWIANRDRRAANELLAAHIPGLTAGREQRATLQRRPLYLLSDRQLMRMFALLTIKLPLALAMLTLVSAAVFAAIGLLVLGAKGIGDLGPATSLGPVGANPLSGAALCLLALPVAVLTVAGLGALGRAQRGFTRSLLLPPPTGDRGPVREMLAESLGDRTLSIAYWLPDREIFVDEAGRTVSLPDSGSGRAWTAVERDGRRVAAIVHDAELDTGPELVHAAATGASLAIDNERLKADLRARVEELRVSRVRIVEAADTARRRIERDLHDGAQQQLVSLALDLRLLKSRLSDAEAASIVDELTDKLGAALAELRELARGIHPVVLTAQGLGPAVESLAHRSAVQVDSHVEVGEKRLSPSIEAAAYFLVAEALTNVVRYARADSARVTILRDGADVTVEVSDDGVGGADLAAGSGLRGIADRISALEGALRVTSPEGRGTRVLARIPCKAASLVAEARDSEPPTRGTASGDAPTRAFLEAPR